MRLADGPGAPRPAPAASRHAGSAMTRRGFLAAAGGAAVLPLVGPVAVGGQETPPLWLLNRHTGEEYFVPLFVGAHRNPRVYPALDYLLRDHRQNRWVEMDRRIYDMLYAFQRLAGRGARVEIVSGYRTPETNRLLRRNSEGVALRSFHMEGRAVDFVVRGMSTKVAAQLAWTLGFGGVGLYGDSFTHCDTGPPRRWGDSF